MQEPLAYSIEEAACLLGISRTKAYESARAGELRTIQVGRRLLVPAAALEGLLGSPLRRPRRDAPETTIDKGVNRVEVVGRLTRDAELRRTRSELALCSMRLAIRRPHRDDAVFIDVVAFGQEADRAASLRKGQLVWIEGRLDQRVWAAEDGSRRETHQIVAQRAEALETRSGATPVGRPA